MTEEEKEGIAEAWVLVPIILAYFGTFIGVPMITTLFGADYETARNVIVWGILICFGISISGIIYIPRFFPAEPHPKG